MQKLIHGLHHFQSHVFSAQEELFHRLSQHGQSPDALFITCSDSRINPNLITQTAPGELFILRNAGNIVPPHGASNGGEGATIEYAVMALGIKDIIICGHSHCGAMNSLLNPASYEKMPAVRQWLQHAEATRRILEENYQDHTDNDRVNIAIQENVLVQLENIRTLPSVASRMVKGELNLHGWVYKIESGEVFAYNPEQGQFSPLAQAQAPIAEGLIRQTELSSCI
ncbi:MAG: carbonic anhydrase [Candidatus Melainabacteria bacterium]